MTMRIEARVPEIVKAIAVRVKQAGGTCSLVGGAVVDLIRGGDPKDWDIEVFGLSLARLAELFADLGPKECGKCFGILKLDAEKCGGVDVDINVPRRDNSVGVGHKDFTCELDPTMTPKEAARRRDFSINSIALDLDTMEVVDPFGGVADLRAGVLRATDPETFVEDPLRALRAMQLLARKAKVVDPATMALIRGMSDAFPHLAKERVHEEWRKLLLKAERPSVGLEFLRESGWLVHFPELAALIGCGQHPEWHPEGDVWVHTLEVVDSAAWARDKIDPEWVEAFVFGAMLHDVGKPATTVFPHMVEAGEAPKDLLWTARGHDRKGVDPAETFMRRMTAEKKLIERASVIVGEHMQPYGLHQGGAKDSAWKRLHGKIRLDIIGWMSRCDCCGRPGRHIGDPDLEAAVSDECFDRFGDLGVDPVQPVLQGRDLIGAGIKPGPHMGVALKAAFEAQLEDEALDREALLSVALQHLAAAG
jgi:tRNA nucleotidyltransferase (CCA-adding enzyme)